MEPAALVPTDPAPFPAVAFVESWFPNPRLPDGRPNHDGREIGTGTLIAPRLILTAAHVVHDAWQGGLTTAVRVTLGGARRFEVVVNPAIVDFPLEWRQPRNDLDASIFSPVDVGIIVLPEPVDRFAPPMRVETASDTMLAGMRLNVLGYPANPPQGPLGSLYGTQFNLVSGGAQYPRRLFYPVATVGGVSGGPVYDRDETTGDRVVRAVHTSLVRWSDGTETGSALRIDNEIKALIHDWIGDFGQA